MTRFLLVCAGGAAGTGARYLLGNAVLRLAGEAFPFHTLAVNLLGSFALGVVAHLGATTDLIPPGTRRVLTTGVLGGFTTYSSFNHETLALLEQGATLYALANVAATLLGCLAAGLLGTAAARLLVGP